MAPPNNPLGSIRAVVMTAVCRSAWDAYPSHMAIGPPTVRTPQARERFLAALAQSCNVTDACKAAGIGRQTAYMWRQEDEAFAGAWRDALDEAVDALEQEVWRRAKEGVEQPVFYQGKIVGSVREYDSRMAEILLKAHRPEKYTERFRSENLHAVAITIQGPAADL